MATTFKFKADGSGYARGLEKMRGQTKRFASGVSGMLGGAFALTGIIAGMKSLFTEMDRIHKLSLRYNMSAEAIQKLGFAAEQNGTTLEIMAKALAQGNRAAVEASNGLKTYQRAFDDLKISWEAYAKLGQEDQLHMIADAMKNAEDKNKSLAAAQTILGRGGLELAVMLRQGSQAIKDITADLELYSGAQVAAAAATNDAINKATNQIRVMFGTALVDFIDFFDMMVEGAKQATKELGAQFNRLGKLISVIWDPKNLFDFDVRQDAWDEFEKGGVGAAARVKEAMQKVLDDAASSREKAGGAGGDELTGSSWTPEEIEKSKKKILDLEKKIAEEKEKAAALDQSAAEKLEEATRKRIALENELAEIKDYGPGEFVRIEDIRAKEYEIAKAITEEGKAQLALDKQREKAANDLAAIKKKIADEIGSREEVDMTDEELLSKAIINRQKLEQELIDLKQKAMEDGKTSEEEALEIAKKKLEVEEAITTEKERADAIDKADKDARDDAADTRKDIRQERRDREEIGMDEGQILARRKEELKAAQATQAALRKSAESDGITGQEEKDIAEGQLAIENLKTEIAGIQQGIDSAAPETPGGRGPSIISSSLASIGGGGGTAMFTADPLLSENQKQTRVLEEIRTALQPSDGLETGTLQIPEL